MSVARPSQFTRFQHISRNVALAASAGAAVVSLGAGLYSYGIVGHSATRKTFANFGAAWVRLAPTLDTAKSIGDTLHVAATVADKAGSILVGATPTWTTSDTSVAIALQDGSIVARGPGATTLDVVVGSALSKARIVVRQHVAGVAIVNPGGDTAATVNEGGQLQLHAHPLDARGHVVAGRVPTWHMDDTTVATVDAHGLVTGRSGGRCVVSVNIDGATAYLPLLVAVPATTLSLLAGADQQGLAGRSLPQRIVVRATTRTGAPATGKQITFRLRGAQGKVDPPTTTTDADGRARAYWTLGDIPGPQTLLAMVENMDTAVVVNAGAEPVAKNTRVAPLSTTIRTHASGPAGDSVGVRITDSTGRAFAGIVVRWAPVDGSVASLESKTDSTGVARAQWNLSAKVGTQRLRAFVGPAESHIEPATIKVTTLPGAPANIVVIGGDRQHAAPMKALAKSVVLQVVDAGGNGAGGVQVTISASSGTVEDSSEVSDSLGYVRLHWTTGRSSGDQTLVVRFDGIRTPLTVVAHVAAGSPANLSFEEAKTSRPRARRLTAIVTDVYGNAVSDALVVLSSKTGVVTPSRAVTDDHGRVGLTWTVGAGEREQGLKGSVKGTDVSGSFVPPSGT